MEGKRHVSCYEHVVGLDCGTNEEAAKGEDGEA
jgi:hypothetical protein